MQETVNDYQLVDAEDEEEDFSLVEEKTRNGILSTLSVSPPRKQRMSFRQRSVTYSARGDGDKNFLQTWRFVADRAARQPVVMITTARE